MCPDQGSSLFSARLITKSSSPSERSRSIRATAACSFLGSISTGRSVSRAAATSNNVLPCLVRLVLQNGSFVVGAQEIQDRRGLVLGPQKLHHLRSALLPCTLGHAPSLSTRGLPI